MKIKKPIQTVAQGLIPKQRVVVYVAAGAVQWTASDAKDIEVIVIDADNQDDPHLRDRVLDESPDRTLRSMDSGFRKMLAVYDNGGGIIYLHLAEWRKIFDSLEDTFDKEVILRNVIAYHMPADTAFDNSSGCAIKLDFDGYMRCVQIAAELGIILPV